MCNSSLGLPGCDEPRSRCGCRGREDQERAHGQTGEVEVHSKSGHDRRDHGHEGLAEQATGGDAETAAKQAKQCCFDHEQSDQSFTLEAGSRFSRA